MFLLLYTTLNHPVKIYKSVKTLCVKYSIQSVCNPRGRIQWKQGDKDINEIGVVNNLLINTGKTIIALTHHSPACISTP